jgi:hypothetical protein
MDASLATIVENKRHRRKSMDAEAVESLETALECFRNVTKALGEGPA